MINKIKIIGLLLVFFAFFLTSPIVVQTVHAVTYDLIAPSGMLTRGQEVQFTININTEGKTIKTAQVGMTYDTRYLQYLSALPGNTFSAVKVEDIGQGKLILTATNDAGFSGSGTFALVNFKLIAADPGSTELCVLFNPETTPTSPPQITPTALPRTGSVKKMALGAGIGLSFLLISSLVILLFNKKVLPPSLFDKNHLKKNLH